MSEIARAVGARLKQAREEAGFRSASAFATHWEIPISTYSQHETGKRVLSADMLIYYSDLLKVPAGWLLSGEGGVGKDHMVALVPIDDKPVVVDVWLLKEIFLRIVPLFAEISSEITSQELIDFAIEVYNGVAITSSSVQDKLAMAELSITSLKRGMVGRQQLQEGKIA